jgi:hypothetical protein
MNLLEAYPLPRQAIRGHIPKNRHEQLNEAVYSLGSCRS